MTSAQHSQNPPAQRGNDKSSFARLTQRLQLPIGQEPNQPVFFRETLGNRTPLVTFRILDHQHGLSHPPDRLQVSQHLVSV